MNRFNLFGISIDPLSLIDATQRINEWLKAEVRSCRYVVTPNVDHIVMLQDNQSFLRAYESASLVLIDGRPVAAAARLFRKPVPETVPGSDLTPAVLRCASMTWTRDLRVFLLGAGPSVADSAAEKIHSEYRNVRVVGTYSPPFGFEKDSLECQQIVDRVNRSEADLLIIGLGAPKQELWILENSQALKVKVALCVGATIDFLAGEKSRAPMWMRRCGLEWAHRVMCEPRRLMKRYAKDALIFPFLVAKEVFLTRH